MTRLHLDVALGMMENANALIVDAALTRASGTAQRESALAMLGRRGKGRWATLGADKAYDEAEFVDALRNRDVTPHIAVDRLLTKTGKRRLTRIDRRTTGHSGYAASQRLRNRIKEGFRWIKTTGGLAKTRHRSLDRVGWMFTPTAVAHNVVKLPWLLSEEPRSCPETAKPPPGPAVSRGSNPRPRHRQPAQDSRNGSK